MAIERAFQTNIVVLPSVPTSIVSVQGKRKDSQFEFRDIEQDLNNLSDQVNDIFNILKILYIYFSSLNSKGKILNVFQKHNLEKEKNLIVLNV